MIASDRAAGGQAPGRPSFHGASRRRKRVRNAAQHHAGRLPRAARVIIADAFIRAWGRIMQTRDMLILAALAAGVWTLAASQTRAPAQAVVEPNEARLMEIVRQAIDGCRVEGHIVQERLLRDRDTISAQIRCGPRRQDQVRLPKR
jgi:hypothetical protein